MASPASKIKFREPQIEMAHGAGGKASRRLVEGLFAPLLFGANQGPLGDAAHIQINGTRIAMTTDSFVVSPLRFPGGSIGRAGDQRHGERSGGIWRKSRSHRSDFCSGSGIADRASGSGSTRDGRGRGKSGGSDCRRRHEGGGARQSGPHVHHDDGHRAIASRSDYFSAVRAIWRQGFAFRPHWRPRRSRLCWLAANWTWKRTIFVRTRARCFRWCKRWCAKPAREFAGCAIRRAGAWPPP